MFPCSGFGYGYWWIFPIIMIGMMALCFFMMKRHGGPMMMCGRGSGSSDNHDEHASDRPLDVLNKRYAKGEINKQEYEEKKSRIAQRS